MKFGQIPYTLGRGHREQRKNTQKEGGLLRVESEFGFFACWKPVMKTDESITAYLRLKLFVVPVITDKLVSPCWQ